MFGSAKAEVDTNFNLVGAFECNGLSKWSCNENNNCEFVIG